jgi:hypothetical protein
MPCVISLNRIQAVLTQKKNEIKYKKKTTSGYRCDEAIES